MRGTKAKRLRRAAKHYTRPEMYRTTYYTDPRGSIRLSSCLRWLYQRIKKDVKVWER